MIDKLEGNKRQLGDLQARLAEAVDVRQCNVPKLSIGQSFHEESRAFGIMSVKFTRNLRR
jgi:hypothetical protein